MSKPYSKFIEEHPKIQARKRIDKVIEEHSIDKDLITHFREKREMWENSYIKLLSKKPSDITEDDEKEKEYLQEVILYGTTKIILRK